MLTDFGKELRKLRIDKGERLLDMAANIGVSSAFLSAVELGKKQIPNHWESKLAETYQLGPAELQRLESAADSCRLTFTIQPDSQIGRDTIGLMARKMGRLKDADFEAIRNIVQQTTGESGE